MSLQFRKCLGGNVKKRQWTSKESWENIKDFVVASVKNGRPQKSILEDLKSQGHSIERYQLQRLLKQWGAAKRNLRKRHRKYIFEAEKRLKEKGKTVRGWRYTDTNERVRPSQLDEIRGSDGLDFEGIDASPGALAPSPFDILQDTPSAITSPIDVFTPGRSIAMFECHHLNLAVGNSQVVEAVEKENENGNTTRSGPMDYDLIEVGTLDGAVEQREPRPGLIYPFLDPGIEIGGDSNDDSESGGSVTEDDALSDSGATSEAPDSQSELGDLTTLLEGLGDGIISTFEKSNQIDYENLRDIMGNLSPEDFSERCSLRFRSELEMYIMEMESYAERLVERVEERQRATGRSAHRCGLDIVGKLPGISNYFSLPDDYTFMSYEMALRITTGDWTEYCRRVSQRFNKPTLVHRTLDLFYEYFPELWLAVGLDDATLADRNGFIAFKLDDKTRFRSLVVHLPYLIATHGLTHYATLFAVIGLFALCCSYENGYLWDTTFLSVEIAIPLLSLFGPSHLLERYCEYVYDTEVEVFNGVEFKPVLAAQLRLNTAKNVYGPGHIRTLQALADLMNFHREGCRENEVNDLAGVICHSKQLLSPDASYATAYDLIYIVEALMNCGYLKEASGIITRLDPEALPRLKGDPMGDVGDVSIHMGMLYTKAEICFKMGDYSMAMQGLYRAIHRFPDLFHAVWRSTDVMELTTKVMTARGMVRYAEPVLERLVRVLESKTNSNRNQLYYQILFAYGSASFQLYLEEDQGMAPSAASHEAIGWEV
ncbi:hypothetical protein ABW19_dt0205267 [Dactylella cylindrospora]|nr:hypothetical protein ABW19_dt0205267 [Dactylella cylindrospora]